jgi:hypothetical protein
MPVRVKAFLIHIVISIVVFSSAFLLAAWLWYPDFYYSANGVWKAVSTVAIVDLALGPLMTLVLFKPGKPGLKFDLSMVAIMQLSALTWGIWVLMSQRPVLTVYDQGIFYCLSPELAEAAQAQPADFLDPRLPVPVAYLPPPANAEEKQRREQIIKQLPAGASASPAYVFGKDFQPITKQTIPYMLHDEIMVTDGFLERYPKAKSKWEAFQFKHIEIAQHFAYFPLYCSPDDHLAAVDKRNGLIVDALPFPAIVAPKRRFLEKIQSKQ